MITPTNLPLVTLIIKEANYLRNPIEYCLLPCLKMTIISIYSIGLIQDTLLLDFSHLFISGLVAQVESIKFNNLEGRVSLYVELTSNQEETE